MLRKITILSGLTLIAGGLFFSSCAPKNTASFTQSRPFYDDTKPRLVQADAEIVPEKEEIIASPAQPDKEKVMASTDKKVIRQLAEIPSIKAIVAEHKANVQEIKNSESNHAELQKQIKKEEKRARKEVKKQLVRELKDIKKVHGQEATNAMNQKIFIGIVVAAAGIVVAILASGGLGSVAIIIGVGLIAWGIIEQGGI